ncbi:MAG: hypothetical protein AAF967_00680 [Pseudomonadota bacterium]
MIRFAAIALCFVTTVAAAEDRGVFLVDNAGTELRVATITVTGDSYELIWDEGRFGDYFLSMRPFKCLEGPDKLWCRVPYPYEIRRSLQDGDLTDVEYDLMFVWKKTGEYGINMWNGVYYQLNETGGQFEGKLNEIDMNVLAAPPENGNLRPIRPQDVTEADPESHWLPRLVIR